MTDDAVQNPATQDPNEQASRLDAALSARGLVRSRTQAARLIADGLVTVDGKPALKASARVGARQELAVTAADHYVSRAAHKLNAAFDLFPIVVEGRSGLDVGASTGGFTQVLLERGAARVIALDVGHEQLDARIRADERVTVIEGVNARFLTRVDLGFAGANPNIPDLVVADLSFISLGLVLPALLDTVGAGADFVLLIKPQFEVGRGGVREGLVRDPALREDAVNGVMWSAWDLGLPTAGLVASPIAGMAGNHEYLVWLNAVAGLNPTEWSERVAAMTQRA